jgi:hypothetical protein
MSALLEAYVRNLKHSRRPSGRIRVKSEPVGCMTAIGPSDIINIGFILRGAAVACLLLQCRRVPLERNVYVEFENKISNLVNE